MPEQALAAAEGGGDNGRAEAQALIEEAGVDLDMFLADLPPELQARYRHRQPSTPAPLTPAGPVGGAGPRRDRGAKRSPGPNSPTRAAKRHRVGSAGTAGNPSEDGSLGTSRGTGLPGDAEGPDPSAAPRSGGGKGGDAAGDGLVGGAAATGTGIEERAAEDGDVDYAAGEEEEDDEGTLDEEEALAAGEGANLKVRLPDGCSYVFRRVLISKKWKDLQSAASTELIVL